MITARDSDSAARRTTAALTARPTGTRLRNHDDDNRHASKPATLAVPPALANLTTIRRILAQRDFSP
jgi:hypothetical protein